MDYSSYSDAELFALLREKKAIAEAAFAELYSRYATRIYNYCRTILRNKEDAEDAFQETFAKFFQSAQQDREMTNLPAYLLRIARNTCLNMKRQRRKEVVSFEEEYMGATTDNPDRQEMMKLIEAAVDVLPEDLREIFILREYQGYRYAEIADALNITEEAARVRAYRARKQVQKILAPYIKEFSQYF